MKNLTASLVASALLLTLSACSLDIVPVSRSRLLSAWKASQPIQRGPNAPGAFTQTWKFTASGGFLMDPGRVEATDELVRLKKVPVPSLDPSKPAVLKYSYDGPSLETVKGHTYAALDGFSEIVGTGNQGVVKYQLSHDRIHWYYHNGKIWKESGTHFRHANTAIEVNAQIGTFHGEIGQGRVFVKAFLVSDKGEQQVEFKEISVRGVSAEVDSWD